MFARFAGPARNATTHISRCSSPNVRLNSLLKRWNTTSSAADVPTAEKAPPRVVFSGIQPTGIPHVSHSEVV